MRRHILSRLNGKFVILESLNGANRADKAFPQTGKYKERHNNLEIYWTFGEIGSWKSMAKSWNFHFRMHFKCNYSFYNCGPVF
jgi:hypothetical protein